MSAKQFLDHYQTPQSIVHQVLFSKMVISHDNTEVKYKVVQSLTFFLNIVSVTKRLDIMGNNLIWQIFWLQPGRSPKRKSDGEFIEVGKVSLIEFQHFFPLQRRQSLIFTNWYIPAQLMNLRSPYLGPI